MAVDQIARMMALDAANGGGGGGETWLEGDAASASDDIIFSMTGVLQYGKVVSIEILATFYDDFTVAADGSVIGTLSGDIYIPPIYYSCVMCQTGENTFVPVMLKIDRSNNISLKPFNEHGTAQTIVDGSRILIQLMYLDSRD